MINNQQKEIILKLLAPLKPVKVAVFGSYARGENKPDSDLDLLLQLDYSNRISLLDLIGVEQDLTEALGIPVEIATEESLSPYVRPYVEKDLTYILK
jgi:predicted nucleotidyltransferase